MTERFVEQIALALADISPSRAEYESLEAFNAELILWVVNDLPHRIEMAWVVGRGNKEAFVEALKGD